MRHGTCARTVFVGRVAGRCAAQQPAPSGSSKEADITFPREAPEHATGLDRAGCWDVADAGALGPVRHAITAIVTAHDAASPSGGSSGRPDQVLTRADERLGLLFNEIAGNALRHGGPGVRADLARCDDGWLLTVRDRGDGVPSLQAREPVAVGGHGLHLVMVLSDRAGWYREDGEKVVWADVRDDAPAHLLSRLRSRAG